MGGSSYHVIASKLGKWLEIVPESQINTSTKKAVNDIKGLKINQDETLVSFNVVSLYTNAPKAEAIREAADLLYSGKFY